MARRRVTSRNRGRGSKPRGVDRSESKIKKWNKASDIPLDEEDQFHASRDRILLEGADDDGDGDDNEEEVFALKGLAESESDEDEDGVEDYVQEDEEEGEVVGKVSSKKPTKSKRKKGGDLSSSDESEESEEEEESWGRNKSAYYSSNAVELESDDEEANEMEEQEARRLQTKARDVMGEDDFGLADTVEVVGEHDGLDIFAETIPPVAPPLPTDKKSALRLLEKSSPETLALARDWDDVAINVIKTQQKLDQLEMDKADAVILGMAHLHHQALITYATTLAFYLHLRASEKYAQRPELLKSHPILPRLLTLKQSIATLEDLDFAASDEEDEEESGEDEDEDDLYAEDMQNLWKIAKREGLEAGELEELLNDVDPDELESEDSDGEEEGVDYAAMLAEMSTVKKDKAKAKSKSKSRPAMEGDEERPKKKRKTATTTTQPIFDLVEPTYPSSKSKAKSSSTTKSASSTASNPDTEMYGDPTALSHPDILDKASRRKSLKFYTSKLEASAAKRAGARKNAVGGDDDVPYKERRKEKERKEKERERRGLGEGGEDLGEDGEDEGKVKGKKRARDEDMDVEASGDVGADGYYALVQQKTKERKEKKKAEYEAAKAASKPDYTENPATGPRALTRAILSNRGLTPHRSNKSVRNPRVKKRQKYEKAQKKVRSQKAVHKAGEGGAMGYGGEKSGISKVVKSVRL
ncbi:hypothetical protein JAAARDRAFT_66272 [Jaapia argillacea MUCL 33604]|uniref:Sas10 C-terminal domain-containing protein n=1 Tax=Jaapia argillacea MUCL 33604 TaxID=933084 RepID=A0A067Q6I6_9AGAM|nr:hypothetical protein JAAARDRAFT_66272 [Jaapia argillacea MUCL 33604]